MSTLIINAGLIIGFLSAAGGFFMLLRAEWVFRQRMRVLDVDKGWSALWAYKELPDFRTMAWQVWKWRLDSFVKKANRARFNEIVGEE